MILLYITPFYINFWSYQVKIITKVKLFLSSGSPDGASAKAGRLWTKVVRLASKSEFQVETWEVFTRDQVKAYRELTGKKQLVFHSFL